MVNKIVEKSSEENKLMARIESITAENDFTKEQLSALKAKYENIKNGEISGLLKPIKDAPGRECLLPSMSGLHWITICSCADGGGVD